MTHFTASWLIPLIIFGVIAIISFIGMARSYEMEALPWMILFIIDLIWYVIYMIIWIIRHYNHVGWFVHIKIAG